MKRVEIMLRQAVLVFGLLTLALSQSEALGTHMGQLAGNLHTGVVYPWDTEISDFEQDGPLHDFTIEDGKLVVQCQGFYYIYGQAFFELIEGPYKNRAAITLNGNPISLLQSPTDPPESATYGNRFTGTLKKLEPGDRIGFISVWHSKMWMAPQHTFFGAYIVADE